MHVLAILTPKPSVSLEKFGPFMIPEEKIVWKNYMTSTVGWINFQLEPLRVLIDFKAPDKATAQALLDTFPMVEAALFDIDIILSGPWLPFTALFEPEVVTSISAESLSHNQLL